MLMIIVVMNELCDQKYRLFKILLTTTSTEEEVREDEGLQAEVGVVVIFSFSEEYVVLRRILFLILTQVQEHNTIEGRRRRDGIRRRITIEIWEKSIEVLDEVDRR